MKQEQIYLLWLILSCGQAICAFSHAREMKTEEKLIATETCMSSCICENDDNNIVAMAITCSGSTFSEKGKTFSQVLTELSNKTQRLVLHDVHYRNLSIEQSKNMQMDTKLERLEIKDASVLFLTPETFRSLANLYYLQMTGNPLKYLNASTFSSMSNLQVLNLSNNELKEIDSAAFKGLSSLHVLDLSHNQLTELSDTRLLQELVSLEVLNISHNSLKYVHPGIFQDVFLLSLLHLEFNNLTSLREGIIENSTSLSTVYLHGNPWMCDCGIKWLIAKVEEDQSMLQEKPLKNEDQLICTSPPSLHGVPVGQVNSSLLICDEPFFGDIVPEDIEITYYHSGWLHCSGIGNPEPSIYWLGPRGVLVHPDQQRWLPSDIESFGSKQSWDGQPTHWNAEVEATSNGSLHFTTFRYYFNGTYTCVIENSLGSKNMSVVVSIVAQISYFVVWSCFYGLVSSSGFLLVSIIFGFVRWLYERFIEKKDHVSEPEVEDDEEYWEYYFSHMSPPDSRESPMKCVTPAEGIDPVRIDLTDDIWETLCDVSHRLRDSVAPKVDYMRTRAHQVRDAGREKMGRVRDTGSRYVQTIKSSSQQYVRSIRQNSSTRLRSIRESSSSYANRVRTNMQSVKEQVRSIKEFCGHGGDIPHTISITSFSTNVDSQETSAISKKVTTL